MELFMEMEEIMIEVKFELDPVCDGIVRDVEKTEELEGACLVIGTNGEYRLVDVEEATEIMDELGDDTAVDFISQTPYAMAYNRRKTVVMDGSRLLIGSVLIVNLKKQIVMDAEEIEYAKKQFVSRLIKIKLGPDQYVTAYEL